LAIFIEKNQNSLIINRDEFDPNVNYLPDFLFALRDLDPNKKINVVIDLDETPMIFILYLKKIREETPGIKFHLYVTNLPELEADVFKLYKFECDLLSEYPVELPNGRNIKMEKDLTDTLDEFYDAVEKLAEMEATTKEKQEQNNI
jgi:hypothetical protein